MGAAIIRPGDVLLLTVFSDITNESAEQLRGMLMEKIPGLSNIVILSTADVAGVYREGDD